MPDIILLVTQEAEKDVVKLMEQLGEVLQQTTVASLPDITEKNVAVMAISVLAFRNATAMQILAIASNTPEREACLQAWSVNLAQAWQTFAEQNSIPWRNDVDVWPILPKGRWVMANDVGIAAALGKI